MRFSPFQKNIFIIHALLVGVSLFSPLGAEALPQSASVSLASEARQSLRNVADEDEDGTSDGQEVVDGTDPEDPDSVIEHAENEYCFDWNGYLSQLAQILELQNVGCGNLELQVDLRDSAGEVQGSVTSSLEAEEQLDVIVNELEGFLANSYGTICVSITSGEADSLNSRLAMYSVRPGSFAYAVSSRHVISRTGNQYLGYNNFFPTLNPDQFSNLFFGYIQVSNDESVLAGGDLVFYDAEGSEIKRVTLSIPAKGRVDVSTHDIAINTVGLIEWIPALSDAKFRLFLNRYYYDGSGVDALINSIVSIAAKRGSGALRAAPFSTVSRIAALELHNTKETAVQVAVSVYTEEGELTSTQPGTLSIPAKGTTHVLLNQFLPSGLGKVQIAPVQAESVVANLFEYGINNILSLDFSSAGELGSGFGATLHSSYNNFLGGCRLRLANISASARTAALSMKRLDGTALDVESPIAIPGNGATEVDVCSYETGLSPSYGAINLTPSIGEAITGELVRQNRSESSEFRVPLIERSICTAEIELSGSPLTLVANGSSGNITVTNNSGSITATGLQATLPSGWTDVTQDASDCASLPAGESCDLVFTPGATTRAQTSVPVQGDNTKQMFASISVEPDPTATISVSDSPLTLQTNGSTGTLTITNDSTTVTALNISSSFTGTALDGNVTETGNTCASVAPSASCTLTYTPGSTVVAQTNFSISGSNTNTLVAAIEMKEIVINSIVPSSGSASGGTGVTLFGTGFTGATSITFDGVAATSVNVVSSTTVTAVTPAHATGAVDVVITTPVGSATLTNGYTYVTTAIGQSTGGGTIACLNGGLDNLIAASSNNSTAIEWGGFGTEIGADARSNTDGASNTQAIVAALGNNGGVPYAAQLCNDYEEDSQGNTPCEAGNTCYSDWFLPAGSNSTATGQLNCLYTNRTAIGGFGSQLFSSSTEFSISSSSLHMHQDFSDGSQSTSMKSAQLYVRCVRAFTP